jgi:hypothetical protein
VKIYKDSMCVEVLAYFDTGAGRSYLADRIARSLGYEPYSQPRKALLATEDKEAEIIGHLQGFRDRWL